MNKIHKSIWNEITGTFVAVAETAKAGGKRISAQTGSAARVFVLQPLALAMFAAGMAHAAPPAPTQLPTAGSVVAGQASISQSNAVMTVNQISNRAVVDWGSFNIGSSATVNFVQPTASSAILNRVTDPNPSQILGRINANGQVFLTNASGIYFGQSANINVGALTATTHSINNDDFMASRLTLQRNGATGSVVNEGNITASLGGYIALLAPEVRNTGVIVAQMGTVALAAGEAYELQFDGNRLSNVRVEPATISALVENGHAVQAPGGLIILSAQAANRLQGGVVNNTGRLEANGLVNNGGTIRLLASDTINQSGNISADAAANSAGNGGTIEIIADLKNPNSQSNIDGSISARGGDAGGDGGSVETSGSALNIAQSTQVSTAAPLGKMGTWLLDPTDFTISAGTGAQTTSGIGASTLENNLAGSSIIIATDASGANAGDISVNANITTVGTGAGSLTLTAHRDINVSNNVSITLTGTGQALTLKAGRHIAIGNGINDTTRLNFQTNNGALTFWSNSNGTGSAADFGYIRIGDYVGFNTANGSTTQLTGGGQIIFGGGADPSTGYASANAASGLSGVDLGGHTKMYSGGGNISVRGQTAAQTDSVASWRGGRVSAVGIASYYDGLINSGNGTVTMVGNHVIDSNNPISKGHGIELGMGSSGSYNAGMVIRSAGGSSGAGNEAITMTGIAANTDGVGMQTWRSSFISTGTGGIKLTGTSNDTRPGRATGGDGSWGLNFLGGTLILAPSGPITIDGGWGGTALSGDGYNDHPTTIGYKSGQLVTSSSSDIVLTSDYLRVQSPAYINSTGSLTVQPYSTSFRYDFFGWPSTAKDYSQQSGYYYLPVELTGISALTLGKVGNTSDITFASNTVNSSNTTINGPIKVYGGNIAINGGITATNSTVTLTASGSVTESNNGNITAQSLILNGTGSYTLPYTTVGTLATGSSIASLNLTNAVALDIGQVTTYSGISSTGAVRVATVSGDLTVSQNIITSNTTSSAVLLNAGWSANAGAAVGADTGGNIVLSGSPAITTGANGRITLITGAVSNTALESLVGTGSGHFRYNSDERHTNYTTPLGAGIYAIYRERPVLTVAVDNKTMTYGDTNMPTLTRGGVTGLIKGDLDSVVSLTTTGQLSSNAGTYAITASTGLGYGMGGTAGVLTIQQAPLTITANSFRKTYDGVAYSGGNGVTYNGFVNSQSASNLGGTLTFTGNSQGATGAGSYAITPQGLTSSNYQISFVNGTLTIDPLLVSIVASLVGNVSKVYDGTTTATLTPSNFSLSGFAAGEGASVTKSTGTFDTPNTGANKTVTVNLSNSDYVATGSTNLANYLLPSNVSGTVGTITAAPLTVTANSASKTYDGIRYSGGNGASYSGFVNNETAAVLAGTLGYAGTSQGAVNAGNYAITPQGLSSANYAITYADGTLSITQRPITVTAVDQSRNYGGANPTSGAVIVTSGSLVNSDTLGTASVSSTATGTTAAGQSAPLKPSNQTFSSGSLSNYAISYADGTLRITQRPITIQADDLIRDFGEANPTNGTVTLTGGTLVNGDTLGKATLSSPAGRNTPAGQQMPLTPSNEVFASGSASNYAITYADGKLSIKAPPPPPPATAVPPQPAAAAPSLMNEGAKTVSVQVAPSTTSSPVKSVSDGISVSLVRPPSEQLPGLITVLLPKEMATSGSGFSFPIPEQVLGSAQVSSPISVKLQNGSDLPHWLRYENQSKAIIATAVPEGAFPLQISVTVGGVVSTIVISEKGQ